MASCCACRSRIDRNARPGRAIVGGQGLEAITHTAGRGGQFRHVLTNFGTFEPGSPGRAMEDWVKSSGGDPIALVRVLGTFADTPLEKSPGSGSRPSS